MLANYPVCEKRIIDSEGGTYTDGVHPYDPGGPTRWGITLADARLHWKANATADDVRTMPLSVALSIYKSKYWDALNCDALPGGVDYSTVDYGVNSGIGRAGKVLRRVLGLPDNTWKITPEVVAALSRRDVPAVIQKINDERLAFLQSLKIWPTYKNGWTTRVRGVIAFSLKLAADPNTAKTAPTLGPLDHEAGIPKTDRTAPKAQVPPPDTTVIKGGTATGGAAAGVSFHDWILAHPGAAVGLAVAVLVAAAVLIFVLRKRHEMAQHAPVPGFNYFVPESKP